MKVEVADNPRLMLRKREFTREIMLDAAERLLLETDPPDFSMRSLCKAAGVSFTTPFNYFGSKNGVLRGVALRHFDVMEQCYGQGAPAGDAVDRAFAVGHLGATLLIERSAVNRAVMVSIMTSGDESGEFKLRARNLWSLAMGGLDGIEAEWCPQASTLLPGLLATAYRGALAMWITRELTNIQFAATIEAGVASTLSGFVSGERKIAIGNRLAKAALVADSGADTLRWDPAKSSIS